MKKDECRVEIVTEAPPIGKPQMMGGIRSKEEAESWAKKNGYAVVYFWLSRQRVYADKLTKRVDVLAQQVETKSDHLVSVSESGQIVLWAVLLFVFVCAALVYLYPFMPHIGG